MTVTLNDDGAGNWSWSGDLEEESGGSFSFVGSLGSSALPAGFTPEFVDLNSIFADPEGPTSSEMSAIDNVSFTSIPEPGSLALIGLGLLALARKRRLA
jgi:hypothetical protein